MNIIPAVQPRAISQKQLVLATDLDGTFLGGNDNARAGLYRWIEENRHQVGLIFVTGRDPKFVRDLTRSGEVPKPDYVIGDVGTTIAEFDDNNFVAPILELEREIEAAWVNTGPRAQVALQGLAGLTLQSTGFRYRLSYDMDPALFDTRALDIVAEMGLDALVSDNRFFDVLPKGVSKGPSLLRLLTYLEIDTRRCLVAGDTLNDLSMLSLGLPAVAVGNSEQGLLDKLAGLDHVHIAEAHGAGGIAEAIIAKNFITQTAA
jgi:hydroxymethylpyrimidine pyrophosphatase-like HAD family hydrolase